MFTHEKNEIISEIPQQLEEKYYQNRQNQNLSQLKIQTINKKQSIQKKDIIK